MNVGSNRRLMNSKIFMTILLILAAIWFSFAGGSLGDQNPRLTLVIIWILCAVIAILFWLGM
jgi:hypothetical protein